MSAIGCPVQGCPNRKDSHLVGCQKHWLSLPHAVRTRIWTTYDQRLLRSDNPAQRDAQQPPEHKAAVAEALAWLNAGVRVSRKPEVD